MQGSQLLDAKKIFLYSQENLNEQVHLACNVLPEKINTLLQVAKRNGRQKYSVNIRICQSRRQDNLS